MNIIKVLKSTTDDWHPNIKGSDGKEYITVSFYTTKNPKGHYLVCVWGLDDCGMELWLPEYEQALKVFLEVCKLPSLTFKNLSSLGLTTA